MVFLILLVLCSQNVRLAKARRAYVRMNKGTICEESRAGNVVIGVGIDLVEISRVKKTLGSSSGERFAEKVLTPLERELAELRPGRRAEFVAGRFAAKEAVVKALGCGIGAQVGFQDIEVRPDERGKPECRLSSAALVRLDLADPEKPLRIHLSITHTNMTAGAYALIEQVEGSD